MNYSDVIISFMVVAVIGLIIIPLPSTILDFLITINMTIGINILLITLFTKSVLEFATFPTLLLITTMFRLGLNISSTRLVLTKGNAGHVIDAFANVVAGNNYIVGAVIFIIITIIQMVVVTNGASRVSEVSARFTLDAMPGKQMAIDADLNAGLISEDEAKKRRKDLQREASFYGAMDGASKFVKGDAIAGIIITLINLLGGILIFSISQGMGVGEALDRFGKLAIGDGLVSQIPSLLISVSSGIIVTRSDDDSTFGSAIKKDFFPNPLIAGIVACVLFIIALVPGFPKIPFFIMSGVFGFIAYKKYEKEDLEEQRMVERRQELLLLQKEKELEEDDSVSSFQVEPISIEIGYTLIPMTDDSIDNSLMKQIINIRKQCAHELGVLLTPIRIRDNLQLGPNDYCIKIKGNEVARGEIYPSKFMVINPENDQLNLDGIPAKEPAFGLDALWIDEHDKDVADIHGATIVEPVTVIATHLKEVIYSNTAELLGRQEVKHLLEGIKDKYNVVIDELIPEIMRLGEVQKVLQNLLKEQIPINDLVTILETLADYGTTTKDVEILTEHVRQSLKRTIVKQYLGEDGVLRVITLHPEVEELVSKSTQKTTSGSIPVLKPETITQLFDSINGVHQELTTQNVQHVILASPTTRLTFRKLISYNFPALAVISLNEVPNEVEIETVGMLSL
ncbi:flagellar biosynthesis protein FlhA [Vagococcus carniphilus]|uniref:flagellar biosynthesis protein FlhA n=1 Tax=Vagococcus carniphilus TaxID=218144 RepID=UPI00288EC391|nr:flagellar biosynthesis protein FlhA [Vagococcus carniphilus]MDT2815863.1 flagellar biosynthesis protein FlhA [Vagococcus carniphilus]MDT2865084.1 flagellar biosynthesis protein FlhA [Vagococcus carniphilus]